MRCKHCGKLNESYELLGIKGIVCCEEYQVDIWSLRPRVGEAILAHEIGNMVKNEDGHKQMN